MAGSEARALLPSLPRLEGGCSEDGEPGLSEGGRWPVAGPLGPSGGEEASVTSGRV